MQPALRPKWNIVAPKILQQRDHLERQREGVYPKRQCRDVTLSVSPGFSSPPSSGMYNSAWPGEAPGSGWILAGKGSLLTVTGPCQSDSIPVKCHTPLIEVVWELLLQGSVGGFSGLLWVCTGPKDGCCWVSWCPGQCPWQVLQHICLKYGRLQNLNLSTRGQ